MKKFITSLFVFPFAAAILALFLSASATSAATTNNIATHPLREREAATATLAGNLTDATTDLFVDVMNGDLHLTTDAAAIDQGVPLDPGLCDYDIDGEPRDTAPDIGADEHL